MTDIWGNERKYYSKQEIVYTHMLFSDQYGRKLDFKKGQVEAEWILLSDALRELAGAGVAGSWNYNQFNLNLRNITVHHFFQTGNYIINRCYVIR